MDEDREKGRIVSLTIRRQKMAEHARNMVPVLAAARSEITGGMQQPVSLRTYADWLNRNDYKTAQDKVWRAQTTGAGKRCQEAVSCCVSVPLSPAVPG